MNQPTESTSPVASQPPKFYWSDYEFAPGYGWHVCQYANPLDPYLPDQILLHEPLRANPFGKIQAAAQARNGQRSCIWWTEWQSTTRRGVYHSYNQTPEGLQLLVFCQPKSGFTMPFRLVVVPDIQYPTLPWAKRWAWVYDLLISLPPMTTGS